MEDITEQMLAGLIPTAQMDLHEVPEEAPYEEAEITVDMLNRRPEIKKIFMEQLGELIAELANVKSITPGGDVGDDGSDSTLAERFRDEQLVNALNSDPIARASAIELLTFVTDCEDVEGEPYYRPSIFNEDNADVIMDTIKSGGFREDRDEVPGKYDHLDEETLSLIYKNPECRQFLSKVKGPITPAMVKSLFRKKGAARA